MELVSAKCLFPNIQGSRQQHSSCTLKLHISAFFFVLSQPTISELCQFHFMIHIEEEAQMLATNSEAGECPAANASSMIQQMIGV